jgi:NADH-quinone oxidoreductase subunit G
MSRCILTDKTFRFKSRVWFNKPYNAHRECTTPGCCGKQLFGCWRRNSTRYRKKMYHEVEEFICNECRFDHKDSADWLLKDQENLIKIQLSIKIIILEIRYCSHCYRRRNSKGREQDQKISMPVSH